MKPEDFELDIRQLAQDEGGGFVAVAPELPGCRSDGETPEEGLRNGYDAIARWIESARELARDIPEPRRAAA